MVPEGWKHRRLSEICTTVTSGSRDWAQYYADDGAKFIRMTNLRRESIWLDLSDLKFVDIQSDSADGKRTSLRAGDILMSITAELGKIGWVNEGLGESYINQHTALIRLNKEKASTMFVAYLLSSQEMNAKINRLNDSGAKAGLNLPTIRAIPLSLPPLSEQKKIAQILATWDRAITTTEQLLANSQQQKKALMQQLLTGKKRLLDENGVRFSGEWLTDTLKNIVGKIYGGGTPSRDNPDYWGGSIPWVTVKDLIRSRIDGAQEAITDQGLQGSSANIVPAGTVIISTRMAVGKTVTSSVDVAINQDLKAISPSENVCSDYLFYWFTYHAHMIEKMGTGSTVKGVQIDAIKSLIMSVPSTFNEQQKIAAVLSSAEQEITVLKKNLDALNQEKKALMQQLLTGKRRVQIN